MLLEPAVRIALRRDQAAQVPPTRFGWIWSAIAEGGARTDTEVVQYLVDQSGLVLPRVRNPCDAYSAADELRIGLREDIAEVVELVIDACAEAASAASPARAKETTP